MKLLIALVGTCLLLTSCDVSSDTPETLVSDYVEAEMDEAIATARKRVDEFLKVLSENNADSFSVKAPITDENGTEHFWLTDVTYKDGSFTGNVGNDPGIVENVTYGQPWTIEKDAISDWMFMRGDMIHGGFTIDPLLGSYPEEEADALREKLVR
jgi:uncharacterized protein YegJ (DUF2314 family)